MTRRAIAFVYADGFSGGVVDGWELELDLVLDIAAMAGSGVGFHFRHGEILMRWIDERGTM
jgi:hypothetical protein